MRLYLQKKKCQSQKNLGATQSTLQDIKVAERAGGFCYAAAAANDDNLSGRRRATAANRNRFIYWRTQHDVLELHEISMDTTLQSNCVRYRFTDAPVLTVSVTECGRQSVVVLVATVSSLHRLNFAHPDRLAASENLSIFHDASAAATRDPTTFYVIGQPTSTRTCKIYVWFKGHFFLYIFFFNCAENPIPYTATSWLVVSGPTAQDALFALAQPNSLMLYTMNCASGQTSVLELKQHYIVPRILTNITGALR